MTINFDVRFFLTLNIACLLGILVPGAAQSAGYTNLNIKGRVQLEIPDDWTISDTENRKRVRDLSEKFTGIQILHTASFAAQSFPAPSRIFVRVSFLKLDPPITQAEVRKEVQANRQQVIKDLADMWKEESPVMWAGLAKNGVKEVGHSSVELETIGGQTAFAISYGRTSTTNPAETVKVTQYHIPIGKEKALITLSYIEGDQVALIAHDRIKKSIVINSKFSSSSIAE